MFEKFLPGKQNTKTGFISSLSNCDRNDGFCSLVVLLIFRFLIAIAMITPL
jgi:hypothetical protein